MRRFIANFNDGSSMNIRADRMETTMEENALLVFNEGKLVGYANLSAVISANLSTVVSVHRREQGDRRERFAF